MICAGTVEMNAEELKERTRQFAHRCVKLALALPDGFLGDHVKRRTNARILYGKLEGGQISSGRKTIEKILKNILGVD